MKRSIALVAAAASALSTAVAGQTFLTNHHNLYDPYSSSDMRSIEATVDGGYVYTGKHPSVVVPGNRDKVLLAKLDAAFGTTWSVTYALPGELMTPPTGPAPEMRAYDVWPTEDQGYVVCGDYLVEGQATVHTGFLLKTDPVGQVQWFQLYPTIEHLYSVVEARDAFGPTGYVACGETDSQTSRTPVVIRADPSGVLQCATRVWGVKGTHTGTGLFNQVIPYATGRYALVGSLAFGLFDADVLVTIVDDACAVQLAEIYGDTQLTPPDGSAPFAVAEYGKSIALDGRNLVVTGDIVAKCIDVCTDNRFDDFFVFRITSRGDVLWAKRYDVEERVDRAEHVVVANPKQKKSRLYVTGGSETSILSPVGVPSEDVFLMEALIGSGVPTGNEVFGGTGAERGRWLLENPDRHLVILGNTGSFGFANDVTYVIERYQNKLKRCHDQKAPVTAVDIELPRGKPSIETTSEPSLLTPLRATPTPVDPFVPCEKVKVSLTPVDVDLVGSLGFSFP